jgi:hypothetical protein
MRIASYIVGKEMQKNFSQIRLARQRPKFVKGEMI